MGMEINILVSSHMPVQFLSDSDCGRPVVTGAHTRVQVPDISLVQMLSATTKGTCLSGIVLVAANRRRCFSSARGANGYA